MTCQIEQLPNYYSSRHEHQTRFAPSPTGVLHIGSVRTALFSWLYARHTGGRFILRIEDTDRERSTAGSCARPSSTGMAWLGLDADEGPYFQTQRFDRYRDVAEDWLDRRQGLLLLLQREELEADARRPDGARRRSRATTGAAASAASRVPGVTPVVRFRNPPDGDVVVDDLVRGRVVFDNAELDDLIILRSDGTPTYNFCVVIDDLDMARHARHPRRRSSQQHAAADEHARGARRARRRSTHTCR